MLINKFPKYIFWSYKEDADLPESIIAEHVIRYGDVKDMTMLSEIIGKDEILKAVEKLSANDNVKKRTNFFLKVILEYA